MCRRTIASSSSKSSAASARASSVLPTPVGPRKRKEPIGRLGSFSPARARRMASATAPTASSWPTTRSCRPPPPLRAHPPRLATEGAQVLLQPVQALAAGGVALLAQRLALDLQLHDASVHLIQFGRLSVGLPAPPRRPLA